MPRAYGFDITSGGQGVVFALNSAAKRDRLQAFGSWETQVRKGRSYVCVRGPVLNVNEPASSIVEAADAVVQQFLDIVAVEERTPLLTVEPHDNLLWRTGPHGLKLQLTSSITFSAGMNMSATVTDPQGNVVPPPPYVPPPHHFAYRYFRYSQAAENILDGYRNMFLALESILDHLAPKQSNEGETEWLARALTVAVQSHGLKLEPFKKRASSDPVDDFLDAHYSAVRCATFHSKSSVGQAIRPGTLAEQDVVLHQLLAVQTLVEALLKSEFSVSLPQSGFYHSGFGLILASFDRATGLMISSGDCPTLEQVLAKEDGLPDGGVLPVKFAGPNGNLTDEWLFLSEVARDKIGIDKIASLRLVTKPADNFLAGPVGAKMNRTLMTTDLDLGDVSQFVFRIRCILRNQQSPKRGFSH
jgi:hypothetical protein